MLLEDPTSYLYLKVTHNHEKYYYIILNRDIKMFSMYPRPQNRRYLKYYFEKKQK